MENIRRNIKLFFVTYGELLFIIIGIIIIAIVVLRGIDNIYAQNNQDNENKIENTLAIQEEKNKEINKQKEEKLFISEFLDYCNDKNINQAYEMLSDKCIQEKYQTIDIFKSQYIDKIFTYKKEYEIEKENELYKATILEGILESGKIENREEIISYLKIEEDLTYKHIYIER